MAFSRSWPGGFGDAAAARKYFTSEVAPRLRAGAAATMGVRWGKNGVYPHIVRLEWVESDGLRVDDPYGALVKQAGGYYSYQSNTKDSSEGDGAKGTDNHWGWEQVASVMSNGDRYVQFLEEK